MRKIIIIGELPEIELMEKVKAYAEKYEAEIILQPEPSEGEQPGIYKQGFPAPVTYPYSLAPYLGMAQMAESFMHNMYADLAAIPSDKPHSKYAKYARQRTQSEIDAPNIGRNEKCPCGSGKKYKKCCALLV